MSNKVCVYAICKDEAKEAEAWYENVKCADDVIVLDTGSTDGTPDILRELGCMVVEKTYDRFRFDEARNDSLDLALSYSDANILFTTDFDERLSDGWYDYVISNWDPAVHTRGVYDNYWEDSVLPGSLNWMHDRNWMWKYPCHEVMVRRNDPTRTDYHVSSQLDMRNGKVVMRHHQDLSKTTRGQYLPLLKLRYEENPKDNASIAYYVRELMYKNSPGEALRVESEIKGTKLDGNPGAWVGICLSWANEVTGNKQKAMAWLFKSYLWDPKNRTAPTKLAQLLVESGNNALAAAVLEAAFESADEYSDAYLFLDNPDVWKWRMADWLGVCYYNLKRYAEALEMFDKAAEGATGKDLEHVNVNRRAAKSMLNM